MNKTVHFILVGGMATRLGNLTKSVPKTLLSIGNNSLLLRQVEQSINSGINKIIISSNERFYSHIKNAVEEFPQVKVVLNPEHKNGPLSALAFLLKLTKDKNVILTLGDIYFCDNPFIQFRLSKPYINTIFLAASNPSNQIELSTGGIVFCNEKTINKLVKQPLLSNKQGFKWSGSAIFDTKTVSNLLSKFLTTNKQELEEFFEYCMENGCKLELIEISDFVNINTYKDLQFAFLFNLKETYKDKDEIADLISKVHNKLGSLN